MSSVRTNNDVEGWHNQLNHQTHHGRLDVYQLAPVLHDEGHFVWLQAVLVSERRLRRHQTRTYSWIHGHVAEYWEQYSAGQMTTSACWRNLPTFMDQLHNLAVTFCRHRPTSVVLGQSCVIRYGNRTHVLRFGFCLVRFGCLTSSGLVLFGCSTGSGSVRFGCLTSSGSVLFSCSTGSGSVRFGCLTSSGSVLFGCSTGSGSVPFSCLTSSGSVRSLYGFVPWNCIKTVLSI